MANAQYWQIPNPNAGQNPEGLNNDTEQPSQAGWASILGTSATPTWSPATNIPFAFQFNGAAVTQFKASSTGVLTFDVTTTVAVPTTTNAALPSALIPDKSVVIWGLSGTGANDAIVTKTFGTAPNRQFWIQYNSYSYPTNATAWCYWSIVLEEGTNNIHIVDHRTASNSGPVPIAITAGLQIDATTAYMVAGSPALNTTTSTTSADDPSDNSYYTFIPGTQPSTDIKAISSNAANYYATGANVPIDLVIRNYGTSPITSYTIKYQEGANPPVSQTISAVNIPSLGFNTTTFTTQYNVTTVANHTIKVWAELSGDVNNANDTVETSIYGAGFIPKRVVTMEEPTGTWCGWCVRGVVYMDSIHVAHPNDVAAISVHNADPMVVAAYDTYMGTLISGYPSLVVDRKFVGDPSDAFTAYAAYIDDFGVADVTQTHTNAGAAYTITANVKPATDLTGDYRLALIVTENDIQNDAYSQANYYSYASQNIPLAGGGYNFQSLPNPIPGSQINYDFVARAAIPGPKGQAGSLPSTMNYNQTYSYNFNYTLPATSDGGKMQFIVLFIETATGKILNASIDGIFPAGSVDLIKNNMLKVTAYPNPVNDKMFLDIDLNEDLHNVAYTVSDMYGRIVSKQDIGNMAKNMTNTYKVNVNNLVAGIYNITLSSNEGTYTTKFVKQ